MRDEERDALSPGAASGTVTSARGRAEAEELMAEIFRRYLFGLQVVENLRALTAEGLEQTRELALSKAEQALRWMFTNPDYKLFRSSEPIQPEQLKTLAEASGEASMQAYVGAVKAASLVFWHSVLDGVAADLCHVTALVAPERWDPDLAGKKISLSDVRSESYEVIRSRLLDKRLAELERESLAKKVEALYARTGARSDWSGLEDFAFDLEKLKRIDSLRHEIVHGNGLQGAARLDETDIDYLRSCAMHLFVMVAAHFGLKISSAQVFKEWAAVAARKAEESASPRTAQNDTPTSAGFGTATGRPAGPAHQGPLPGTSSSLGKENTSPGASQWRAALEAYRYPVDLSELDGRDSYSLRFEGSLREGDRSETMAFESYFRENGRESLDPWCEVVFWKLYLLRHFGKHGELIRKLRQSEISSVRLWSVLQSYAEAPGEKTLRDLAERFVKNPFIAVVATFPAFAWPERFPMIDRQTAKWVNENRAAFNDAEGYEVLAEFRVGQDGLVKQSDWLAVEKWYGFCRTYAARLQKYSPTDPPWRARDVEMAVWHAQKNGIDLSPP